jgi:hypothetical protein
MIDIYCERIAPGLLAEPVNAVTNLAFFVAASAAWRYARQTRTLSPSIVILISLVLAIAVGSTLFHTFANRWAMFADVIPILLFQIAYLWVYAARVIALGIIGRVLVLTSWIGAGAVFAQLPDQLNGSLAYAPALIALALMGLYHMRHAAAGRLLLLQAAAVLLLSLVFRTIDIGLCPSFPLGTHFLWHLLNGVVLYLSLKALLSHLAQARDQSDTQAGQDLQRGAE